MGRASKLSAYKQQMDLVLLSHCPSATHIKQHTMPRALKTAFLFAKGVGERKMCVTQKKYPRKVNLSAVQTLIRYHMLYTVKMQPDQSSSAHLLSSEETLLVGRESVGWHKHCLCGKRTGGDRKC